MGDKSPKAMQRDQKQKNAAKARGAADPRVVGSEGQRSSDRPAIADPERTQRHAVGMEPFDAGSAACRLRRDRMEGPTGHPPSGNGEHRRSGERTDVFIPRRRTVLEARR